MEMNMSTEESTAAATNGYHWEGRRRTLLIVKIGLAVLTVMFVLFASSRYDQFAGTRDALQQSAGPTFRSREAARPARTAQTRPAPSSGPPAGRAPQQLPKQAGSLPAVGQLQSTPNSVGPALPDAEPDVVEPVPDVTGELSKAPSGEPPTAVKTPSATARQGKRPRATARAN
jgi:hypothetical protein